MIKGKFVVRFFKGIGFLAGLLLLLFLVLIIYQTRRPVKLESLSLVNLSDHPVHLDSLLVRKHTVLNFWATWCKPCIEEMPMLDSVARQLDQSQWQILLISDESSSKIAAFRSRHNFSMPFLRSEQPLSTLGVAALPKTIVVDEKSNVLYTKTGGLTMGAEAMREMLNELTIRE